MDFQFNARKREHAQQPRVVEPTEHVPAAPAVVTPKEQPKRSPARLAALTLLVRHPQRWTARDCHPPVDCLARELHVGGTVSGFPVLLNPSGESRGHLLLPVRTHRA